MSIQNHVNYQPYLRSFQENLDGKFLENEGQAVFRAVHQIKKAVKYTSTFSAERAKLIFENACSELRSFLDFTSYQAVLSENLKFFDSMTEINHKRLYQICTKAFLQIYKKNCFERNVIIKNAKFKVDAKFWNSSFNDNRTNELIFDCTRYAFYKLREENLESWIFQKEESSPFLSPSDALHRLVHEFSYSFTSEPTAGTLIIYFKEQLITHWGIFNNASTVESKWGTYPYIFLHPIDVVPSNYGTDYLMLKKQNFSLTQLKNIFPDYPANFIQRFTLRKESVSITNLLGQLKEFQENIIQMCQSFAEDRLANPWKILKKGLVSFKVECDFYFPSFEIKTRLKKYKSNFEGNSKEEFLVHTQTILNDLLPQLALQVDAEVYSRQDHSHLDNIQYVINKKFPQISLDNVNNSIGKPNLFAVLRENDYQAVDYPQAGDIVVYLNSKSRLTHAGIYRGNNKVESKWDNFPYALIHPLENIPTYYENQFLLYRDSSDLL